MNDVQAIEEFRVLACRRPRRTMKAVSPRSDPDEKALAALGEIAAGRQPIHLPDTQEYVEWTNPAYHDAVIPKLHEGRFSVQAFLDLHGCTVPEAEAELDQFFQESFKKGYRCVKVIHGRGLRSVKGPRVKDAVIRRLSGHFRKDIIAFVTARQCDGGLGALYVLIGKR
jgi:DNA-nicking Smr family endonuclease